MGKEEEKRELGGPEKVCVMKVPVAGE